MMIAITFAWTIFALALTHAVGWIIPVIAIFVVLAYDFLRSSSIRRRQHPHS